MTYIEREHLTRAKLEMNEATEAVNFNLNPDDRIGAAQALQKQMNAACESFKSLCREIGVEIDSHTPIAEARATVNEILQEAFDCIRDNIAQGIEASEFEMMLEAAE